MGEARRNPRSPQYTGPLPEFDIQPVLGHQLVASPEWLEANKEAIAAGTEPPLRPEDCMLEIALVAGMLYPSKLTSPEHWKRGGVPLMKLAAVPFVAFKAAIDAQIDGRAPLGASMEPPPGQEGG